MLGKDREKKSSLSNAKTQKTQAHSKGGPNCPAKEMESQCPDMIGKTAMAANGKL